MTKIALVFSLFSLPLLAVSQSTLFGHRQFADQLANVLQTNQNDCTSALSLSMAMSLLYPIMEGDSKTQVESVFGYDSSNDSIWANASQQINSDNQGACLYSDCEQKEPTVFIANSVWVDGNFGNVNPVLTQLLAADELLEIDFSDTTAGGQVNAWVNTTTQGLIETIVDDGPLSPYVVLALNSIYLKASWATPFVVEKTNQDAFYASPDRSTVVSDDALFLHQVKSHPYSHEAIEGYQVLQLPFLGGSLSMILALPLDTDADSTGVNSTTVLDVLPQLSSQRVALAIPKFQFETTYEDSLKAAIRELGVEAPFQGGLCIYENDCSVALDLVIQKTFISVDEEGVEAAAVTALAGVTSFPTDQPILFLADHPFQFYIYDSKTELVLFEGRVGNPEPQADAPAVSLLDKHVDAEFWNTNFGVQPTIVDPPTDTPTTTLVPVAEPTSTPITSSAPAASPPVTPNSPVNMTIPTNATAAPSAEEPTQPPLVSASTTEPSTAESPVGVLATNTTQSPVAAPPTPLLPATDSPVHEHDDDDHNHGSPSPTTTSSSKSRALLTVASVVAIAFHVSWV